jgi:hypothetical protein
MSIGYLVAATIVAWCTFSALAPLRRPRARGAVSFLSALVFNEQPWRRAAKNRAARAIAAATGEEA